jgi:hypothetical protein
MAIDVKAALEGANQNIWLKVVRSCKEAERAKIEFVGWTTRPVSSPLCVRAVDFGMCPPEVSCA